MELVPDQLPDDGVLGENVGTVEMISGDVKCYMSS